MAAETQSNLCFVADTIKQHSAFHPKFLKCLTNLRLLIPNPDRKKGGWSEAQKSEELARDHTRSQGQNKEIPILVAFSKNSLHYKLLSCQYWALARII